MKYYLHKEGQFLDMNGRMGKRLKTGITNEVQVSAWSAAMRPEKEENNCKEHDFDDCLYNALEREMTSQTKENCTVPWTRNNSKICTNSEDIEKAFSISWNRGTNQVNNKI